MKESGSLPEMLALARLGLGLKQRAGDSTQVSPVSSRDPVTGAIPTASQGLIGKELAPGAGAGS